MKILAALWGAIKALFVLVLDTIRDFFEWLRKPGAKLKVLVAVLAFVTAIAAMRAYEAEQRIVVITANCERDKGGLQDTIDARDLTITQKDAALAEITDKLEAEAEKLKLLQGRNAALAAENAKKAAAAEKSAEAFNREFDNKPPSCAAALEMMEAACPTLTDY